MLFTTVPFLIIFAILRAAYPSGEFGHYYAWLPFNIGGFPWLGTAWTAPFDWDGVMVSKVPFTLWYFIVAFAFGSIITRLFGVTPSGAARSQQKKFVPKQEEATVPTTTAKEKLARTKHSAKRASK